MRAIARTLGVIVLLLACCAHAERPGFQYICPMHAEVRRAEPGGCRRCGMALVPSVRAAFDAFGLDVGVEPPQAPAGREITLDLSVIDPTTGKPTSDLRIVHERPFHLFIVSNELDWFEHVHPEATTGAFRVRTRLPHRGRYQLIADFFPETGTPQVVQRALLTAGDTTPVRIAPLRRDGQRTKRSDGLHITLSSLAWVSARDNRLELTVTDDAGNLVRDLEPYLGAPMHALLVSSGFDVAEHTHGALVRERPGTITFDVRPPRSSRYRLWVQVQRGGKVITVPFSVSATPAPPSR